jgi:hypothetical protein
MKILEKLRYVVYFFLLKTVTFAAMEMHDVLRDGVESGEVISDYLYSHTSGLEKSCAFL